MKKRLNSLLVLLAMALVCVSSLTAEPERPASHAIARIWRGRTLASKADEYQAYLDTAGDSRESGRHGPPAQRRREDGVPRHVHLGISGRDQEVRGRGLQEGGHPAARPRVPARSRARRPPLRDPARGAEVTRADPSLRSG